LEGGKTTQVYMPSSFTWMPVSREISLARSRPRTLPPMAREMLKVWLETPFEGGRHQRRLKKLADIERRILKGEEP